jgi:hypothetical protein
MLGKNLGVNHTQQVLKCGNFNICGKSTKSTAAGGHPGSHHVSAAKFFFPNYAPNEQEVAEILPRDI